MGEIPPEHEDWAETIELLADVLKGDADVGFHVGDRVRDFVVPESVGVPTGPRPDDVALERDIADMSVEEAFAVGALTERQKHQR